MNGQEAECRAAVRSGSRGASEPLEDRGRLARIAGQLRLRGRPGHAVNTGD